MRSRSILGLALGLVVFAHGEGRAAIVVEQFTDRAAFEARLGGNVSVVDFDDVNAAKGLAPFGARRYLVTKGAIVTGEGGQYASSNGFGSPDEFVSTSAPNLYAPGPLGQALGEGGNETSVTFRAALRTGMVAGVGVVFVDADFPGDGPSSLTVYDALGAPLGSTGTVSGGDGSQLFRGIVAVDTNGNLPTAVITRAVIVNGQGWPGVFDNEGVGLDDLVFGSPTAIPGLAGEICDNCVDDDGDGAVDRLDTECRAPAFAAGNGLGDPKGGGKRVDACQKAIEKSSAKFVAKRMGRLFACLGAISKCTQLAAGAECLAKAQAGCTKSFDGSSVDFTALVDAVGGGCGQLDATERGGLTGLGFSAEVANCQDRGVPDLDSATNLAVCLGAEQQCRLEKMVGRVVPRALEYVTALGRAGDFPCLPAGANGGGAGIGGAAGKAVLKCDQALQKGALKFVQISSKVGQKCVDAAAKCIQEKPGVTACRDKASSACAKAIAKLTPPGTGTFAKLFASVAKKCGAASPLDIVGSTGLGFGAPAFTARCDELDVPLGGPADLLSCVGNELSCQTLKLFEREIPRGRELAELLEVTLPERLEP